MARPIALQLYTLREQAKKDYMAVLKTVAEIGYSGVELAGLYGLKPKEFRKILDDLGLKISSAHGPVFDPAKSQEVIDEAQALGYTLVGGGFRPDDFASEDKINAAAQKANEAVERLGKAGLKVFYHNHWWEWSGPNRGELFFKLCPKIYAQFDIYWIKTGGADPVKTIEQFADRTILLHVKDGPCDKDKAMTAVGKGQVDIKAALAAAEKSKAEWYVVELDRCDTDMVEAVRESYRYLVGNRLATGRK